MLTETAKTFCPYCGAPIELVLDTGATEQSYIEDCEVCCRPMVVSVSMDDDGAEVYVRSEDEV